LARGCDGVADRGNADRKLVEANAERRDAIIDRAGDGGGRAEIAAFAGPLLAEHRVGRRRAVMHDLDRGQCDGTVAGVDDMTGLRAGQAQWWTSWKAPLDDRRGQPFLGPILDWLDDYDNVLSNLVDRTALARYLVWDVTLDGMDSTQIDDFVKALLEKFEHKQLDHLRS